MNMILIKSMNEATNFLKNSSYTLCEGWTFIHTNPAKRITASFSYLKIEDVVSPRTRAEYYFDYPVSMRVEGDNLDISSDGALYQFNMGEEEDEEE